VTGLVAHAVVGHQGGWDEGLVVLVPIAIFVALQVWSRRRSRRRRDR
jgi:hypothetical protein